MMDHDEPFWPASRAEHLDQLAQAASQHPRPIMPEARLVEDVRTVYTEYTRAGERVWARLAERLAERDELTRHAERKASKSMQSESVEPMPVEHGQFATRPALQSKPPRRSGSFFTLLAAVLVAAVLVGSTYFVFTSVHWPTGETIVASATTTVTPPPSLTFPCPQTLEVPVNIAPVFGVLCQEQKLQVVQQSYKLRGKQTLTLVAGYADRTGVTLWFHVNTNIEVTLDGSASSPQQANGPGNFSIGAGGCDFGNPGGVLDCVEFFALQHVPAVLGVLDLQIQESIGTSSQDQVPVIAVFRVSLPVHADR